MFVHQLITESSKTEYILVIISFAVLANLGASKLWFTPFIHNSYAQCKPGNCTCLLCVAKYCIHDCISLLSWKRINSTCKSSSSEWKGREKLNWRTGWYHTRLKQNYQFKNWNRLETSVPPGRYIWTDTSCVVTMIWNHFSHGIFADFWWFLFTNLSAF